MKSKASLYVALKVSYSFMGVVLCHIRLKITFFVIAFFIMWYSRTYQKIVNMLSSHLQGRKLLVEDVDLI